MRDFKGYQLFGILFFFVISELIVLSALFSKFLLIAGAGRLVAELLILAGATVELYFSGKTDRELKDRELKENLRKIGFLIYFRLFEVFLAFVVILSVLLILWLPEAFNQYRIFYLFLGAFLILSSGLLYGVWKFTVKIKKTQIWRKRT